MSAENDIEIANMVYHAFVSVNLALEKAAKAGLHVEVKTIPSRIIGDHRYHERYSVAVERRTAIEIKLEPGTKFG